jgi:hypothetical protein
VTECPAKPKKFMVHFRNGEQRRIISSKGLEIVEGPIQFLKLESLGESYLINPHHVTFIYQEL